MSRVGEWGVDVGGGRLWGGGGGVDQILRTALHTISIGLQNSFCESHTWRLVSWKALKALNARWALPVYLVFKDKKSNGSDEKFVKRKIKLKDRQD